MLSIFFIIVSVSVSAVSKNAEKKEIENFLEQLSSDFYYAQIFAISNGLNANTSFVIDRARSEYKVQVGLGQFSLDRFQALYRISKGLWIQN